ncbi:hypothetical protein ACFX2I_018002 [Malus domestica]
MGRVTAAAAVAEISVATVIGVVAQRCPAEMIAVLAAAAVLSVTCFVARIDVGTVAIVTPAAAFVRRLVAIPVAAAGAVSFVVQLAPEMNSY